MWKVVFPLKWIFKCLKLDFMIYSTKNCRSRITTVSLFTCTLLNRSSSWSDSWSGLVNIRMRVCFATVFLCITFTSAFFFLCLLLHLPLHKYVKVGKQEQLAANMVEQQHEMMRQVSCLMRNRRLLHLLDRRRCRHWAGGSYCRNAWCRFLVIETMWRRARI